MLITAVTVIAVAGVPQPQPLAGDAAPWQTAVFAGWDGKVRGVLVVADTIKPTSAEAITRLRGMGLSSGPPTPWRTRSGSTR